MENRAPYLHSAPPEEYPGAAWIARQKKSPTVIDGFGDPIFRQVDVVEFNHLLALAEEALRARAAGDKMRAALDQGAR